MSEQRIERWIVREPNGFEWVENTRADALKLKDPDDVIIRLVEIRDGEPHPDELAERNAVLIKRVNELMEQAENWQKNMWDATHALIERAEKAEAALERATRDDGGWVPVAELRRVQSMASDERGRFERETAAKLIGQNRYDWNNDNRVYTIETKTAIDEARQLADHYFGAKEAKGDE